MTTAVLVAALIAVAFGLSFFANANPADIAALLRRLSAWAVIGFAALLAVRGQVILAGPLMVVGTILLRKYGGLGSVFPGGATRGQGQKSKVRTRILAMELDHDTGEMDGEVLTGEFAGRQLSSLGLDELMLLYLECEAAEPQSSALLGAYLDRAHPEWREREGVSDAGEEHGHTGSSAMSREEALEILGLALGATREEIRKAHKALMKQFHPDQGGSSYIASKINQAKDLLLE